MTLYTVIPCYNEEEVLNETSTRMLEKYKKLIEMEMISENSKIVFVDDGSKDKTWEIISTLHENNPIFQGVKLSRNKGHQQALLAGMMTIKEFCDVCISLDADLQDDINAIDEMIVKAKEGCDIVYGVRSARDTDTFFKKTTAEGFYKVMRKLGVEVKSNHADYRLLSKRALEALAEYKEVNLFLRGIVPLIGFKSDIVYYKRSERFAGESKYPLKKMLDFAWEGITSFSVKPIKFITALGGIIFAVSIAFVIYALIRHFAYNITGGWASLMASIWAIGGLQLFAIGIIGEYIGKIYLETKGRPKYFVDKYLH